MFIRRAATAAFPPSSVLPTLELQAGGPRGGPSHSAGRGLSGVGAGGHAAVGHFTTSTATYITFKVFKVESKSLLSGFLPAAASTAEVFSASLHFPEITWQSDGVGGNCVNSILPMKGG